MPTTRRPEAPPPGEVTRLLHAWRDGDETARERLIPFVYQELRQRAAAYLRHERRGYTFRSTDLVNETYLRLRAQHAGWENREQFFGVSCRLMRRIFVDHARARAARKRNWGLRVTLSAVPADLPAAQPDLLDLDAALEELAAVDEPQARLVELRYFGGLSVEEAGPGYGRLARHGAPRVGDGEGMAILAARANLNHASLVPRGPGRVTLAFQPALELDGGLAVRDPLERRGHSYLPRARRAGEEADTTALSLGQSVVWLARPKLNLLVETVWTRAQAVAGSRLTESKDALVVSPGLRFAHDFANGLQVVPGIAFPIGIGPSRGERSVFVYLSLEHPFRSNRH